MFVHAGKYRTADKNTENRIHKKYNSEKAQSKIQQNKTTLVQSPFMMLSHEMRWALFYNAPEPK